MKQRHNPGVTNGPTRFAAVIPARNEAQLLPQTLTAIRTCPDIDWVIVVDDGSNDDTADLAHAEGATVLRHSRSKGKGAALTAGADTVLESNGGDGTRGLLFLDADLGSSAAGIGDLTRPVMDNEFDLAIAIYKARGSTGGRGFVVGLARRAIMARTGWGAEVPLSGVRALTLRGYEAVRPLAPGWGVETAMTIDALRAGLRVGEVATTLTHRATGNDWRSQLHRLRQYRDVRRALLRRPVRRLTQSVE